MKQWSVLKLKEGRVNYTYMGACVGSVVLETDRIPAVETVEQHSTSLRAKECILDTISVRGVFLLYLLY